MEEDLEIDIMKGKTKSSLLSTLKGRWWLIDEKNTIFDKIIRGFTDFICHFPEPIRKRAFTYIDKSVFAISRIITILNQIFLKGYIVSGQEKFSGERITILFISEKDLCQYLKSIIFLKNPQIEKSFKINIINYNKKVKKLKSKIDGVFVKCDRFYSGYFEKKGFTIIPEWVTMKLDISEPLDDIYKNLSKGAKEEIRKIKKHGFTYEISQDKNMLELFYNKMYLPYITHKYGEIDTCANFYAFQHLFERGSKILFVKLEDEYLFGGLFSKNKNKVSATYAGVMEGKYDYIQKGAIAASYYYLIQHSKEKGANEINFGSCRSFLNDGVYSYKRKWATIVDKMNNTSTQVYSFKNISDKPGIKSFIDNNPFATIERT